MKRTITAMVACLLLGMASSGVLARPEASLGSRPAPALPGAASPPDAVGGAVYLYLPLATRLFSPTYVSPFGVALYHDLDDAAGLANVKQAGARWTSTYFSWEHVEPSAPVSGTHTYNWAPFDTKVDNATNAGLGVYAMFSWNPSWAATLPGGPVTTTANLLAVVSAAAERYDGDGVQDAPGGPVVNHWAFYMEPDNRWLELSLPPGDRGYWGHQPAAYADLLAQIANAVHGANPDALVMPGAVAYDYFYISGDPNSGSFERTFLASVLDRLNTKPGGAAAYIDAVPFHYYPISPGLWSDLHEKAQEIRGIMNARGVGHLPLLVPEMGYWSSPVPPPNQSLSSSPDQQARRLVQMYLHGLSAGITFMNWFQVFDGDCCSPLDTHGLFFNHDLNNPKPAYTAYQVLVREMTGAYYVGPVSSPGIAGYSFSMWHLYTKTAVWATQPTATMTFYQGCLRRVDHLGNVTNPVLDGNPTWDKDSVQGQITLQVIQNETLYLEGC